MIHCRSGFQSDWRNGYAATGTGMLAKIEETDIVERSGNVQRSERQDVMHTIQRQLIRKALVLVALTPMMARGGTPQASTFATIYSFKGGSDGASPNGLTLGKNGALYGTTYAGGSNNTCNGNLCGTVFELAPVKGVGWTKTVLHDFNGADGAWPSPFLQGGSGPRMVFGGNGALYGTTEAGGTSWSGPFGGTVFELAPPATAGGTWTESVLYNMGGSAFVPNTPLGGVIIGPGGTVYGTTSSSYFAYNTPIGGTVFALTPPSVTGGSWTERTLVNFYPLSAMGWFPEASVVSVGGSLYGTTYLQGLSGPCGSVYEVSPPAVGGGSWTGTAIFSFGGADGCFPLAPLTVGPGGIRYGTTIAGGSGTPCTFLPALISGCGTLFQLTPPVSGSTTWTETVIYSFTGLNGDGAYPAAAVVSGKNGVLYGTTLYGGSATSGTPCTFYGATGCGTVFQLTPPAMPGGTWTETILHSFTGQNGEGSIPGPLTVSRVGLLNGPTWTGGTAGKGTIFAIQP